MLGVGAPYKDYTTKMEHYYDYLMNDKGKDKDEERSDDDIVLLIDAYDVLVFPHIHKIDQVIYKSKTPILFCSEAGIYVEYAGNVVLTTSTLRLYDLLVNVIGAHAYYPRGKYNTNHIRSVKQYDHRRFKPDSSDNDGDRYHPDGESDYESFTDPEYFLNSGCIVGRRKEMKQLFSYVRSFSHLIRDDQQIMYRYHMLYPSLSSLDVYHDFSLTTFQQSSTGAAFNMLCTFDLFYMAQYYEEYHPLHPHYDSAQRPVLFPPQKEGIRRRKEREYYSIGLIHSNNKHSNGFYNYFMKTIVSYYIYYFDPSFHPSHSLPPVDSNDSGSGSMKSGRRSIDEGKMKITSRLLEAVWLINDGEYGLADEVLSSIDSRNRSLFNYVHHRAEMMSLASKTIVSNQMTTTFPDTLIHILYQLMVDGIHFEIAEEVKQANSAQSN